MPFAVCILDGIWIVWYACWKRQSHDWRECETSLRRWRWSFLEKSCYPYLWSNCQGMHAVLFSLKIKFWASCIPFCFYLLYHYSIYWKAPLWIGCLTGSWKKQTRKIKTFSMEELWWFKRILLVLDFHLLHFSFSVNKLLEINLPFFNYRSVDCFRLGWPMRADADFFCLPIERLRFEKSEVATLVKWGLFISFSLYSPCSNSAQAIRFALKLPPKIHVLINLKIWSK